MRNNGWKRAGCVLLVAQMTVSVLPMDSVAAYVNGQGRSGAILEASMVPKAVHTGRSSFRLSKDQMPLLTKHVVSFASDQKTALDASQEHNAVAGADTNAPVDTEKGLQDTPTQAAVADEGLSADGDIGKEPPVILDETGGDLAKPELPDPGGETSTTPPVGGEGPTEEPILPPDTGEGEETPEEPILPPDTGGGEETPEEPILPPDTGGGEETPEEPILPPDTGGGEETPEEPILPPDTGEGEETPEEPILPPDTGGEEETPSDSPTPEEPSLPPEEPEGTEPTQPPELLPAPPIAEPPKDLTAGAPATIGNTMTLDAIYINVYGYTGWANQVSAGVNHKETGGGEGDYYIYPPYNWETPPGSSDFLNGAAYIETKGDSDYLSDRMTGDETDEGRVSPKVTALASEKLNRVPDLRFEGWVFGQVNPSDKGVEARAEDERKWNNRYWSYESWLNAGMSADSYQEEPFEATFDALLAHSDVNQRDDYGDLGGFDMCEHITNVVAKWVESDRADLTKLSLFGLPLNKSGDEDKVKLELYDTDFTTVMQKDQQPVELTTYETGSGDIEDEYYVQVPVHIDRLTMDFTSYEPGTMIKIEGDGLSEPILYRYDRKDYIWYEVSGKPTIENDNHYGEDIEYDEYDERNVDPQSPLLREQPGRSTGFWGNATNSYEDPARANWSLPIQAAIPLGLTNTTDVYTDVTITVVAPDGSISEDGTVSGTSATYTLHVRRMADPEMKLNPGNTPYGMIEAETRCTWDKDDVRTHFDDNRAFPTGVPVLIDHNGGAVYQGKFGAETWIGTDYDKSDTALVVYQDATFTDPGFTLTDSQGATVDSRDLKRSIRLRRVSALSTACIHEGAGEEVYYQARTLVPDTGEVVMETVVEEGGKDTLSLRGMNIVPGIYTIEYSYEDPASQQTYNSVDKSVYMETTRADDFSRPLIVLPKPGDVDMDGMITLADALALEELLDTPGSFVNVDSSDKVERLFKYRVCDVDGDGKVTKTDVATLKNGYVPREIDNMSTDYFYLNAGDKGEQERNDLVPEPPSAEKAEISVEYLGKNIIGVPSGVVNDGEVELGETFWIGVKLRNAAALPNSAAGVKAFEFTFFYDPAVLSPGYLKGLENDWKATVEASNLSGDSTTPWKDAYTLVGNSGPRDSFITYPELAVPGLASPENKLSAYTIALQVKPGETAHQLGEGYLLYIPFTMTSHPVGTEHSTISLIEPAMGGREFSIVYTNGSVAAWSGQETIFGDNTNELKTSLAYTGMAKIPVGEDKTPCITLYDDELDEEGNVRNARYGEAFTFNSYGNTNADYDVNLMNPSYEVDPELLPPGMSYDPINGIITTVSDSGATQAGHYRFYIGGVLYQIIVDKAPLTLTVTGNNGKFYGETNPKSGAMTFGYEPSQLKKPELDRISAEGLRNDGKGSNLTAILADTGYKRPTLVPVDEKGVTLGYKAPAGTYITELTGGVSTNYVFQYLRKGETEPNNEKATNTFTVSQRPIIIEKIEGSVGKLGSKPENDVYSLQLTARYGSGPGNFVAKLPEDPGYYNDPDSMYQLSPDMGPVLNGDDLALSYMGVFQRTEKDRPFEFVLDPENVEEERPVKIAKGGDNAPKFIGSQAGNYQIFVGTSIPDETTGTVFLVPVTELEITGTGNIPTEYTYGDPLSLVNMGTITLRWENGEEEGPFEYNPSLNTHNIMLSWVEKKGDLPSAATSIPGNNGEILTAKEHDGKYLCVYVSNGKSYDEACAYLGPYTVHKAKLTLTVASQERYYGEPDDKPVIKYKSSDLKSPDKNIYRYGLLEELETQLAGFSDLEISYRQTASANGKIVDKKTDVGDYFVVLSKAVADNYIITYTQPGTDVPSEKFGYADMAVRKRPIFVDRVTGTVGFFYNDTKTTVKTVRGKAPSAENQGFTLEVSSPTTDYWAADSGAIYERKLGKLTGSSIVEGDTLSLTYQAVFDKDNDKEPFFDTNGWTTDKKSYGVTIGELKLDTATGAGRNYELVYNDKDKAIYGRPRLDERSSGDVVIRRIDHLEIRLIPPVLDYTYGDKLQLDTRFAVRVYYALESGQTSHSYEDVYYEDRTGVLTGNTFTEKGLWLEWSDENGKPVEGGGKAAYPNEMMTVTDHDGRYLVVKGQNHESHEEKVVVVSRPVTVAKKVINVKPKDIQRIYGENNVGSGKHFYYETEVDWKKDLIPEDWDKLAESGKFNMDYTTPSDPELGLSIYTQQLGEGAKSPALTYLDPTYKGPEFRTAAREDTPVGKTELVLSGGEMANYAFAFKPGVVEVTKRLIYLREIEETLYSLENPLATMIVGGATSIPNVMASYSPSLKQLVFEVEASSKPAVLGEDEVTVSMTVEFGYNEKGDPLPPGWLTVPDGEMALAWVKISNVKLIKGSKNYELRNSVPEKNLIQVGRIDGRTIERIEFSNPGAIKTQYNYGENLDLGELKVNIFYKAPAGAPQVPVDRNVSVTSRGDLSLHYLPDPTLVEDPNNWEKIAEGEYGRAAAADLLCIAPDEEGFSHQGKYLVVSAKASRAPGDYAKPLVVSRPLSITPRTLEYTLRADTRPYDGTTRAWGTVLMDMNQIHPGDVVYMDNGRRYDSMEMEKEGVNYLFPSNPTYGVGFRFEFADKNVAYEQAPGHDDYGTLKAVPAGVYNISLSGKDAANYVLGRSSIPYDDPAATSAVITRAHRPAPDVASVTTMSTDIHTNTVTISVDKAAPACGDAADAYNDELHYEYKLEYMVEETDLAAGFREVTEQDSDSPFFGGEPVEVTSEDFEPAPDEKDELTPGMGQPTVKGDTGFGSRSPLPRDTYLRAMVRLAGTHNYEPSAYTPSVSDADMVDAIAAARAAEESDEIDPVLSDPKEIEPPRPIPEKQNLGKTYQYRLDVVAAQTMRGTDGKEHVRSQLDSVWFADRATYPREDYLNAFITDAEDPRYQSYSWDPRQGQSVRFPLDMEETVVVNMPQADGTTAPETVCGPETNGTIRLYASLVPPQGGGTFYKLTILNGDIVAHVGDEPVQLQARVEPGGGLGLYWESSDITVVTVDRNGLLTFVGEGTARISVSFGDYRASIMVTVLPPELKLPEVLFNWDYLGAFMEVTKELEFHPEWTMSRGELALILDKFLPPLAEELEGEAPVYVDMDEDMECYQAVESLSRLKLLKGVGEDRFAPEQTVTRAEIAAVLARMASLPAAPLGSKSFQDSSSEDTWAWAEIEALGQAGITKGTGDNYFSPDRQLTRAETAVFLTRMLRYKLDPEQAGLICPTDVDREYWAWREIMQAVNGADMPEKTEEPEEK